MESSTKPVDLKEISIEQKEEMRKDFFTKMPYFDLEKIPEEQKKVISQDNNLILEIENILYQLNILEDNQGFIQSYLIFFREFLEFLNLDYRKNYNLEQKNWENFNVEKKNKIKFMFNICRILIKEDLKRDENEDKIFFYSFPELQEISELKKIFLSDDVNSRTDESSLKKINEKFETLKKAIKFCLEKTLKHLNNSLKSIPKFIRYDEKLMRYYFVNQFSTKDLIKMHPQSYCVYKTKIMKQIDFFVNTAKKILKSEEIFQSSEILQYKLFLREVSFRSLSTMLEVNYYNHINKIADKIAIIIDNKFGKDIRYPINHLQVQSDYVPLKLMDWLYNLLNVHKNIISLELAREIFLKIKSESTKEKNFLIFTFDDTVNGINLLKLSSIKKIIHILTEILPKDIDADVGKEQIAKIITKIFQEISIFLSDSIFGSITNFSNTVIYINEVSLIIKDTIHGLMRPKKLDASKQLEEFNPEKFFADNVKNLNINILSEAIRELENVLGHCCKENFEKILENQPIPKDSIQITMPSKFLIFEITEDVIKTDVRNKFLNIINDLKTNSDIVNMYKLNDYGSLQETNSNSQVIKYLYHTKFHQDLRQSPMQKVKIEVDSFLQRLFNDFFKNIDFFRTLSLSANNFQEPHFLIKLYNIFKSADMLNLFINNSDLLVEKYLMNNLIYKHNFNLYKYLYWNERKNPMVLKINQLSKTILQIINNKYLPTLPCELDNCFAMDLFSTLNIAKNMAHYSHVKKMYELKEECFHRLDKQMFRESNKKLSIKFQERNNLVNALVFTKEKLVLDGQDSNAIMFSYKELNLERNETDLAIDKVDVPFFKVRAKKFEKLNEILRDNARKFFSVNGYKEYQNFVNSSCCFDESNYLVTNKNFFDRTKKFQETLLNYFLYTFNYNKNPHYSAFLKSYNELYKSLVDNHKSEYQTEKLVSYQEKTNKNINIVKYKLVNDDMTISTTSFERVNPITGTSDRKKEISKYINFSSEKLNEILSLSAKIFLSTMSEKTVVLSSSEWSNFKKVMEKNSLWKAAFCSVTNLTISQILYNSNNLSQSFNHIVNFENEGNELFLQPFGIEAKPNANFSNDKLDKIFINLLTEYNELERRVLDFILNSIENLLDFIFITARKNNRHKRLIKNQVENIFNEINFVNSILFNLNTIALGFIDNNSVNLLEEFVKKPINEFADITKNLNKDNQDNINAKISFIEKCLTLKSTINVSPILFINMFNQIGIYSFEKMKMINNQKFKKSESRKNESKYIDLIKKSMTLYTLSKTYLDQFVYSFYSQQITITNNPISIEDAQKELYITHIQNELLKIEMGAKSTLYCFNVSERNNKIKRFYTFLDLLRNFMEKDIRIGINEDNNISANKLMKIKLIMNPESKDVKIKKVISELKNIAFFINQVK
jgi:hypothetical protein